ncbi:MAG: exopolysaccharide biosynthesis polyprenyl glycosylphosphotransferase, partial [Rhizobiaceae bacterium]
MSGVQLTQKISNVLLWPSVEESDKEHSTTLSQMWSPFYLILAVGLVEFGIINFASTLPLLLTTSFPVMSSNFLIALNFALVCIISLLIFAYLNLYRFRSLASLRQCMFPLCIGWILVFSSHQTFFHRIIIETRPSAATLGLCFVLGFAVLIIFRTFISVLARYLCRQGRLGRKALLFGADQTAQEIISQLNAKACSDIRICGIYDDRNLDHEGRSRTDCPTAGDIDELVRYCRLSNTEIVIVNLPLAAQDRLQTICKKLGSLPVDIRLADNAANLRLHSSAYSYEGDLPLLPVNDRPIVKWDYIGKWMFDKGMSFLLLILCLPLMLFICLAIKLDSRGPVLFKQKRYGFNNELITVHKFRSMYVDQSDHQASRLVARNDPRVTRLGRFLRKSSLDELPQIFNVLTGTLSLVGPRPHAQQAKAEDRLYQDVVDSYYARHRVKPGVTGWAQINGFRGETDTEDKIQARV